jgi:serine/threonine protein kinase
MSAEAVPLLVDGSLIIWEMARSGRQRELGRGTFGIVYAAMYNIDGRLLPVAVKTITAHLDSGGIAAFYKEVKIQSELDDEHVVKMVCGGELWEDGFASYLLIMHRMAGSLDRLLLGAAGVLVDATLLHRVRWLHHIASALEYLHGKDIIHGDLKPANVMLDTATVNATAKVIDFGLSTKSVHLSMLLTRLTDHGVRGTRLYMDPELLLDNRATPNKYNDIYSLGILGWQLLTGCVPFEKELNEAPSGDIFLAFENLVRTGARPPLEDVELPTTLKELLKGCWATNGAERPNAKDVVTALGSVLIEMSTVSVSQQPSHGGAGASAYDQDEATAEDSTVSDIGSYYAEDVAASTRASPDENHCRLHTAFTDEGLEYFPTRFTSLDMQSCHLIRGVWFSRLINIITLDISDCNQITDGNLATLVNLTTLRMAGCIQIGNAGIGSLVNLTLLDMSKCIRVTDAGLKTLTQLKTLYATGRTIITDDGIVTLKTLTTLRITDSTRITGSCFGSLPLLTALNMTNCWQIPGENVATLTNLTVLRALGCRLITDATFEGLVNLEFLEISDSRQLRDAAIRPLKKLSTLLMNNSNQITDAAFLDERLEPVHPFLTNLDISNCHEITNDCLSRLTSLTTLSILNCRHITDKGIKTLTNLSILHMRACNLITDTGIAPLVELENLDMRFCTNISGACLINRPKLKTLTLIGCNQITNEELSSMTQLWYLSITDCTQITDACLSQLVNLGTLYIINCTQITDNGLSPLLNLTTLYMDNCSEITDAGLSKLTRLKELGKANCTQITDHCLKKLPLEMLDGVKQSATPLSRR